MKHHVGRGAVVLVVAIMLLAGCSERKATLSFAGDIMLSRDVAPQLAANGFEYPYRYVREIFLKDDLSMANLECPVTTASVAVNKSAVILFKAAPENAGAMKAAGLDMLNLANNHVMDYGSKGLQETLEQLNTQGVMAVGAGQGYEKAHSPVFITKGAVIFGLLDYSVFPAEGYIHTRSGYDVARVDETVLYKEIAAARSRCDYLIINIHWGKEFRHFATTQQKELAHGMIDAGADLIVGHHPHVLQGVEKYKGGVIVYSLGNFVFDRQIPEGTDEGAILQVVFQKKKLTAVSLIPIIICEGSPERPSEDQNRRMLKDVIRYSENMGTVFRPEGDKWMIE